MVTALRFFFSPTVRGLVSHLLGYFSRLQLRSKPMRLVVAEANVFISVATSSQF